MAKQPSKSEPSSPRKRGSSAVTPSQTKTLDSRFRGNDEQSKADVTPRLRFPEFRDQAGFDPTPLGGAFRQITNGKANAQDHEEGGAFPLFDRSEVIKASSKFAFDAEAVILPGEGMSFRPRYFDGKFDLHQRAYALMECQGHGKYFFYALDHAKAELALKAVKSTVLSLRLPIIEKFVVFAPPDKDEQQKIADCLTSLDEVIAAQGRKVETLKAHKRGLMQQLFPREGETRPRLRFPEFRNAPDWTPGEARDIVEVLQGYGFPERLQGNTAGKFPFYKVSDISACVDAGGIFLSGAKNHIDANVLAELRAKPMPVGATVFAKIGEAIRSNKRAMTARPCLVDNNAAGVKAIDDRADDSFVYYLWSQVSLIDYAGGVVPAVNKSAIEQIPVCWPKKDEQQRIANCLTSLDTRICVETDRLTALKTHKQGLMQQLFPAPDAATA